MKVRNLEELNNILLEKYSSNMSEIRQNSETLYFVFNYKNKRSTCRVINYSINDIELIFNFDVSLLGMDCKNYSCFDEVCKELDRVMSNAQNKSKKINKKT